MFKFFFGGGGKGGGCFFNQNSSELDGWGWLGGLGWGSGAAAGILRDKYEKKEKYSDYYYYYKRASMCVWRLKNWIPYVCSFPRGPKGEKLWFFPE